MGWGELQLGDIYEMWMQEIVETEAFGQLKQPPALMVPFRLNFFPSHGGHRSFCKRRRSSLGSPVLIRLHHMVTIDHFVKDK
jgi:hypothetical protein